MNHCFRAWESATLSSMDNLLDALKADIARVPESHVYGRVASVLGLMLEGEGLEPFLSVGARCTVLGRQGEEVPCEVVGFRGGRTLLMPFADVQGVGIGCKIRLDQEKSAVYPCGQWLGRVVNAFGQPVDGKGPLPQGPHAYPFRNAAPPAHQRKRVGKRMDLGVAAINCFLTCCRGQRMGIFSGSGVGKSTLLSMIARYSGHDVNVIGLIGERGREVQEFIEDYLGVEGLKRSVVVVATSDESALMRKQATYLTMSLSEYFRDEGKDVLCLMDSVTRFAMSLREIGLSAGEPPTTKGYTPTVFAELPKLLERAGPGTEKGVITGLFSVLVEGDDQNEPITDAVRGILDGHIVMSRRIAERGRLPAIDILKSVSRTMPECNPPEQAALIAKARRLMATYEDMQDMIRLGAYRKGSDEEVDAAIFYHDKFEQFLRQGKGEKKGMAAGFQQLQAILAQAPTAQKKQG